MLLSCQPDGRDFRILARVDHLVDQMMVSSQPKSGVFRNLNMEKGPVDQLGVSSQLVTTDLHLRAISQGLAQKMIQVTVSMRT
ncbi:hypothetical protein TIFTF001_043086 [Ficus carica]|uniref:Uncharacterized protein n=1 Tax=Ficus carica TaxID=3494 RepID=A0AA87YQR8_FICCA|nr:hypothetical protein TIFTF001_043086 [Ficus carica]